MSDNKDNMNKITNDELGEVAGGANKMIPDEVLAEVKPAYGVSICNSEHLKCIIGQKAKDKDLDKTTDNKAGEICEKITNDELGEVSGGLNDKDLRKLDDIIKVAFAYGLPKGGILTTLRKGEITKKGEGLDKVTDNKAGEICEKITNDE